MVFSDGTGQEGGVGNNTNVYKLFNMIEDRTPHQISFYDRGIGTGWRKLTGNIGGLGISRNIKQCYRFILDYYEVGDQIFLIGFSRGAATVRSLSSFIHYFGILPKCRPELIKKAYRIYKYSNDEKRKRKADEFVSKHHNIWTRIKFIGCFDTVAALGLPIKRFSSILNLIPGFKHKFHNFSLSASVENAYHALSIDDERKTFHPLLWKKDIKPYQTMRQVWFSGMHTDVGGGYKEQDLSDIPLVWMLKMGQSHGLKIYSKHKININEDENGFMHDSQGTWVTKLYRRKVRHWDFVKRGKPLIHHSVIERIKNRNNESTPHYNPWILKDGHETEPWVPYVAR